MTKNRHGASREAAVNRIKYRDWLNYRPPSPASLSTQFTENSSPLTRQPATQRHYQCCQLLQMNRVCCLIQNTEDMARNTTQTQNSVYRKLLPANSPASRRVTLPVLPSTPNVNRTQIFEKSDKIGKEKKESWGHTLRSA